MVTEECPQSQQGPHRHCNAGDPAGYADEVSGESKGEGDGLTL